MFLMEQTHRASLKYQNSVIKKKKKKKILSFKTLPAGFVGVPVWN